MKEEGRMNQRILIIEDSPTQALRAQWLLEEAGYQAETAGNGQVGLEQARSNPPDLVVADIMMPVMDGYEMTRRLKADPRMASVPVLMLTTKDQPLDIIRGLEVGADQFITKPYEDDYLVERIRALLGQLAEARAGRLPEQQELASFSQEIVITKSREQVLQMLLQATARIIGCEAMALLLHNSDGWPLFILSFQALETSAAEQLGAKMADVLTRLSVDLPASGPTRTVQVVAESAMDRPTVTTSLHNAFMHAPLMVEGQVTGLVGAFSSMTAAFDIRHVRFLFDMGQKAAEALSRVRVDSERLER
jgi:DNA-binding response OmpR family regulator